METEQINEQQIQMNNLISGRHVTDKNNELVFGTIMSSKSEEEKMSDSFG
jgi:hypothetical protein